MDALATIQNWAGEAAGAVVSTDGVIARSGDTAKVFELASVTKLYTALAALVAHEEGTLGLDEEIGGGFTAADLLAHSSGVSPSERRWLAPPHTRRIYSTSAYDILADELATRAEMPFADYAAEAVAAPLGMSTFRLDGSPGRDGFGSVDDLIKLAGAWAAPLLVDEITLARATSPHRPELPGVLPGYGSQDPNPWGLGPEIRGRKTPHWTSTDNDPTTFGHFGQSGTMLWIDPAAGLTVIALCDQPFGPWATAAWPMLSSAVLAEHPG